MRPGREGETKCGGERAASEASRDSWCGSNGLKQHLGEGRRGQRASARASGMPRLSGLRRQHAILSTLSPCVSSPARPHSGANSDTRSARRLTRSEEGEQSRRESRARAWLQVRAHLVDLPRDQLLRTMGICNKTQLLERAPRARILPSSNPHDETPPLQEKSPRPPPPPRTRLVSPASTCSTLGRHGRAKAAPPRRRHRRIAAVPRVGPVAPPTVPAHRRVVPPRSVVVARETPSHWR